jgi:hypothetical protein
MKVMDIKIFSGMAAVQTAPFMGRETTARSARSRDSAHTVSGKEFRCAGRQGGSACVKISR